MAPPLSKFELLPLPALLLWPDLLPLCVDPLAFCKRLRPAASKSKPGPLRTGLSKDESLVDFVPTLRRALVKFVLEVNLLVEYLLSLPEDGE